MSNKKLDQLFQLVEEGKQEDQEVNLLGVGTGTKLSPIENMLPAKKAPRRTKREVGSFEKISFNVSRALHSDLKTYAASHGQAMQHIVQSVIKEFVAGGCKAPLKNDYELKRDNVARTSMDLDSDVYEALCNFSISSGIKKRFIIEALLSEFLRSMK